MLRAMARVQIIGTKRRQDKTVQVLHRLGVIQIDEWEKGRSLSIQRMALSNEAAQLRERLSYAATRVEAVLAALGTAEAAPAPEYDAYAARPPAWLLHTVEAELAEVAPQAQELATRRDQLEEQLGALPRYEATLRQLLPLVPALVDLEHYAVTAILVERRHRAALAFITRQLEELTGGLCDVISRDVDQDMLAAVLVFPKTQAGAVNELLGRENIAQVRLPADLAG